jgi:Phosphotransferase enzyme family
MMDATQQLKDWIADSPPLRRMQIEVFAVSEAETSALYRVEWSGGAAVFKHFLDTEASGERPAEERANAEVEGLRTFSPLELAPGFILYAGLPPDIGGYGVLYRWVQGEPLDALTLGDELIDLYAEALWRVHNEQPRIPPRLIAPAPRNLENWWIRTHERYRELPEDLRRALPPKVEEVVGRLVQSVAADTHIHKRYWEGLPPSPVHGDPVPANAIVNGESLTFVGWERFGLGDPAFELAGLGITLALAAGEEASRRFISSYLARSGDDMLNNRVDIYLRLLPFGRFIHMLQDLWQSASDPDLATSNPEEAVRYLRMTMQTFGRPQAEIEEATGQASAWMSDLATRSHERAK